MFRPTEIKHNVISDFKTLSCGVMTTMLLDQWGSLYVYGKVGSAPHNGKFQHSMGPLDDLEALSHSGVFLSKKGKLGIVDTATIIPLCDTENFVQLCGDMEAWGAIHENGDIYYWTSLRKYRVIKSNGRKKVKIGVNAKCIIAIDDQGSLYSWGESASGQLGLGKDIKTTEEVFIKLPQFDDLKYHDVDVGPCTNLLMTSEPLTPPWGFPKAFTDTNGWIPKGFGRHPYSVYPLTNKGLSYWQNQEYSKFAQFWNNNLNGGAFDVDQVYAVSNPELESQFKVQYNSLLNKWSTSEALFKRDHWKKLSQIKKKQNVYDFFQSSLDNYEFNSNRNMKLMLGVHGTSEAAVWSICQSGFASLATVDEGWYGRGMYFTSNANYAAKYSKEKVKIFIISYLIPGNIYPVTEEAKGSSNSLAGRPSISGYQSHGVLVNSKGMISNGKGVIYDELVVFQESQIVPKYVVFATHNKAKRSQQRSESRRKNKEERLKREQSKKQEEDDDELSDELSDEDELEERQLWGDPLKKQAPKEEKETIELKASGTEEDQVLENVPKQSNVEQTQVLENAEEDQVLEKVPKQNKVEQTQEPEKHVDEIVIKEEDSEVVLLRRENAKLKEQLKLLIERTGVDAKILKEIGIDTSL